ncbi:MAG: MFS transporter, partial [Kordiimonadaceae bacterium]|nr:MFS transporter [Kordiimonadaceae bacterium]
YGALILIGVGWNFMFTAGTTLLEHAYDEHEKAYVQGLNDLVVFGLAALATLASGFMLETVGWDMMNNLVIVVLILLIAVILWFVRVRDTKPKDRSDAII